MRIFFRKIDCDEKFNLKKLLFVARLSMTCCSQIKPELVKVYWIRNGKKNLRDFNGLATLFLISYPTDP